MKLIPMLLAAAHLAGPAPADTPVRDQIQAFLGTPAFSDAFHVGDAVTLSQKSCNLSCTQDGCAQICMGDAVTVHESVTSCTADSVTVQEDSGSQTMLRTDFDAAQGQLAVATLDHLPDEIGVAGTLTLSSATPLDYALADGRTVPALSVAGNIVGTQGGYVDFAVVIGKGAPALAQVLSIQIMGDTWSAVTDIKP
jgi:hypothetical protein